MQEPETTVHFELTSTMDNSVDETDFEITNIINTILPGEKHLPGMNYCGPGTNLKLKQMV